MNKMYLTLIALVLISSVVVVAQSSTSLTWLMQPNQSAQCQGAMHLSPSGTGVMATCQPTPVPSAQAVLERLQAPMDAGLSTQPIVLRLVWDPPATYADGTPYDPAVLSHYMLYMCSEPIVAGGPGQDDPQQGPVSCNGQLVPMRADTPQAEASYPISSPTGTVYYRVTSVTTSGIEAKLGNEVREQFNFGALTAITTLRKVSPSP
jgi:hypothetical protein